MTPVLIDSVAASIPDSLGRISTDHASAVTNRPNLPREESLVLDERSSLRPACVVESKLTRLLKEASLPASRLQMRAMLKAR